MGPRVGRYRDGLSTLRPAPGSGHGPGWALAALAVVPLAFLAVFFALPLGGMLARGFYVDGSWDFSGIGGVLGRSRTVEVLWFTVVMAAAGTVLTVALGMPLAYVLYRLAFPGRGLLRAVVVMPFVLPTVVVGVMFRSLLSTGGPLGFLGLDRHWSAILMAYVFFNLAVVVRTVGSTWEGMDRRAEDSAAALGATPWQVWRTITLPALTPAIISAATLVFLFCATAFGVVLTLGGLRYGTIETEIYLLTTQFLDLRAAAVLSVLQLVAVVAMLGLAARARNRREQALR
nr:iron ABC transporter permease [Actinomycetota bacterium]